jgi:hypothetical protein
LKLGFRCEAEENYDLLEHNAASSTISLETPASNFPFTLLTGTENHSFQKISLCFPTAVLLTTGGHIYNLNIII